MQAPAHAQQQPEEALLRLQYAMALLRLVNGISDSGQKGRLALSVAQLANDAGVAGLLVTCTLLSCLALLSRMQSCIPSMHPSSGARLHGSPPTKEPVE